MLNRVQKCDVIFTTYSANSVYITTLPFRITITNWKSQDIPYVHLLGHPLYQISIITATSEARVAQAYYRYVSRKPEHFIFDEKFYMNSIGQTVKPLLLKCDKNR